MKKKIFLLISALLCVIGVLCACSDEETGTSGSASSGSTQESGTVSSTVLSGEHDHEHDGGTYTPDANAPETDCRLNEGGHYWYDVSINKNTGIYGSVKLTGKCYLCGESLSKEAVSLVTYEEWKSALSLTSLSSFTAVFGGEYTDYSENDSVSWRINDGTYSADYFVNYENKSSGAVAQNFSGFALMYNDFKYDSVSKTYVYWINESSYVELGFADGKLLSHSTVFKNGENEQKSSTLYLNYQRVSTSVPEYLLEKFNNAVALDTLKDSALSGSLAEGIYNELSVLDFTNGQYEVSLLENDGLSVYFCLSEPRVSPVSDEEYSTVSVVLSEGQVVSVAFGDTMVEVR